MVLVMWPSYPKLHACWLAGTLPMAAWANLSALTLFSLSGNSISGTLPNELVTAWPNLASLDLSGNRLAGRVPARVHRASSVGRA